MFQGEGEAAERDKKRFARAVVIEVVSEVVRRIDTENGPFEGSEGKRDGSAGGPFIQSTDCW